MSKTIYIGKKSPYLTKSVYEILGNLKNFGVGRYLQRDSINRLDPSQDTYYKVIVVEPQMDEKMAFGRIWVEEVLRGLKYPKLRELNTWNNDYILVPKHKQPDFSKYPTLGVDTSNVKLLPKDYRVPPVMAEYLNRKRLGFYPNIYLRGLNKSKHGYDSKSLTEFTIPRLYNEEREDPEEFNYRYRVCKDGEEPTIVTDKFIHKRFLDGVVYDEPSKT